MKSSQNISSLTLTAFSKIVNLAKIVFIKLENQRIIELENDVTSSSKLKKCLNLNNVQEKLSQIFSVKNQ